MFILKLLYNTISLPHLTYGILLWGYRPQILFLQKKVIRKINNSHYLAHTEPIFKRLEILKEVQSDKKYNLRIKPIIQPLIKREKSLKFHNDIIDKNIDCNILCKTKTHSLEGFTNCAITYYDHTHNTPIKSQLLLFKFNI